MGARNKLASAVFNDVMADAKLDLCPTPMPNLGPYAH
jgi:hypothetical protein